MRITEDVRKFAEEQKISEEQALQAGMEQKAREFTEAGAEIYSKGIRLRIFMSRRSAWRRLMQHEDNERR
jgi:hypothetical protein